MGMLGPLVPLDMSDDGICDCFWGRNRCPNPSAYILKNRRNAGFMIACVVHTEYYLSDYGAGAVIILEYNPRTVRALTALAKLAGLK